MFLLHIHRCGGTFCSFLDVSDSDGGGSANTARSLALLNYPSTQSQNISTKSINYGARDGMERMRNPEASERVWCFQVKYSHSCLSLGGRRPPILPHPQVSIGPWLWPALQPPL